MEVLLLCKGCKKFIDTIENGEFTRREAILSAVCLFLLGMFIGIFTSPKKYSMIGCNNGNNNVGNLEKCKCECEDEEEE